MWIVPLVAAVVAVASTLLGHTTPSLALYDTLRPLEHNQALANRTVWVTGASSGIGAALVCQLNALGNVKHIVLSARNVTRMQKVIDDCTQQHTSNTTFSIVPYDALNETEDYAASVVEQAIASTPDQMIDTVVLATGVYQLQPAAQATTTDRHRLWRTNYHAAVDLTQAWAEWVQRKTLEKNIDAQQSTPLQTYHLVVLSSIMAKGPHALCSTYAATKAALVSYFSTWAAEHANHWRVQLVLPGATATAFWQHAEENEAANAVDTNTAIHYNPAVMVTPQRVARLTVQAMRVPRWFFQIWISNFDGLLYVWMSHYLPGLFHAINHYAVAPLRQAAFAKDRSDLTTMLELGRFVFDEYVWSNGENSEEL